MHMEEELKRQVNEGTEMECQLVTNYPNFHLAKIWLRSSRFCPALPKSICSLKRYI